MFWRLDSCDSGQWRCPLKSHWWCSWGWGWRWEKHLSQFSASLETYCLSFVLAVLPVSSKLVLNSRVRCAFSNVFFRQLSMEWTGKKDICSVDPGDPIQICGGAICGRSNSFKLWWSSCHAPNLCSFFNWVWKTTDANNHVSLYTAKNITLWKWKQKWGGPILF